MAQRADVYVEVGDEVAQHLPADLGEVAASTPMSRVATSVTTTSRLLGTHPSGISSALGVKGTGEVRGGGFARTVAGSRVGENEDLRFIRWSVRQYREIVLQPVQLIAGKPGHVPSMSYHERAWEPGKMARPSPAVVLSPWDSPWTAEPARMKSDDVLARIGVTPFAAAALTLVGLGETSALVRRRSNGASSGSARMRRTGIDRIASGLGQQRIALGVSLDIGPIIVGSRPAPRGLGHAVQVSGQQPKFRRLFA